MKQDAHGVHKCFRKLRNVLLKITLGSVIVVWVDMQSNRALSFILVRKTEWIGAINHSAWLKLKKSKSYQGILITAFYLIGVMKNHLSQEHYTVK